MLVDKFIKKFICILQLLILAPLSDYHYTDIKNLLDKARNIKNIKKNIMIDFLKQKKLIILNFNQGSEGLRKESEKFIGFTDTKNFARANQNQIYLNLKFGPTSTKLEKWIEI